jgi:hypothetical protein
MLGAGDIVSDFHWFPEALDWRNRTLHFVRTDRERLGSKPFLSETFADKTLPRCNARIEELAGALNAPDALPHLNFIWHTSFCCSTLISQALDVSDENLSLREPDVLNILAQMKRAIGTTSGSSERRLTETTLRLVARPFDSGTQITVKPSNVANYLVRDVAKMTTGKMLFLYSDCRSFLLAVAKRGEARRGFIRRLFAEILKDGHEQANWVPGKLFEMSDLQIAALIWHMQIAEFHKSISSLPAERFASLDCDAFLDAPALALSRLAKHFGFVLNQEHLDRVVGGPMLTRNAKNPDESMDVTIRRQEQLELAPQLTRDVDAIVGWSYDVCKGTPCGVPLPNSILEIEKSYHP